MLLGLQPPSFCSFSNFLTMLISASDKPDGFSPQSLRHRQLIVRCIQCDTILLLQSLTWYLAAASAAMVGYALPMWGPAAHITKE